MDVASMFSRSELYGRNDTFFTEAEPVEVGERPIQLKNGPKKHINGIPQKRGKGKAVPAYRR